MTKKKFKILDILFFTLICSITECVNIWLFNQFGNYQVFTLSFVPVLGMIAIFRWNAWGIITPTISAVAGIVMRLILKQTVATSYIVAYVLSFFALLVCLVLFKNNDKANILSNKKFFFSYYFAGYAALEISKAVIQAIAVGGFSTLVIKYFSYDLLNITFNFIVFYIACKQGSLVVDMEDYLIKMNKDPSSARMRKETNNYISLEQIADKNSDVSDIALLDGGTLSESQLKAMSETYGEMENKESFFRKEKTFIENQKQSNRKDNTK